MSDLKKTPLFPVYQEFGAKTVEFGGWDMPVQFSSILQEHEAVRERVGLFDVSHMGEFEVLGADAGRFLQKMVTNDVSKMEPGAAMYSPMTYEHGGCVDDLLIYCFSETKFWVVVNAGNIEKDYQWFLRHVGDLQVTLRDMSDEIALLALQGPEAEKTLQTLTDTPLHTLKYYRFVEGKVAGISAVISRTGYTGEDGFELYIAADVAVDLWRRCLAAGEPHGILPCGLGCRDTLRLEARLPLYGHELTESITPLEAGLGMFVKLDKGDFIGREALSAQKQAGLARRIVGIQLLDRGIPRAEYGVFAGGEEVGKVTSGTMSPTLKVAIGLALVNSAVATVGQTLAVDIRGKHVPAAVVKTPFYKRTR